MDTRGLALVAALFAGCAMGGSLDDDAGLGGDDDDAPVDAAAADAAIDLPDAAPGTPDAAPGAPDAAPLPDAAPPPPACEAILAGLATGFEAGAGGWTHVVLDGASAAGWPLDEWQLGKATSGPGSCHGGTACWATRLDDNYTSCQRAALVSPALDLTACAGRTVRLTFWHWHDFWKGQVSGASKTWYDGGVLEITSDGTTWQTVTPQPAFPGTIDINPAISSYQCVSPNSFHVDGLAGWVGASNGWQQVSVTLPAAALTASLRLRFAYASGVSHASNSAETNRDYTRPGWYIDDLALVTP